MGHDGVGHDGDQEKRGSDSGHDQAAPAEDLGSRRVKHRHTPGLTEGLADRTTARYAGEPDQADAVVAADRRSRTSSAKAIVSVSTRSNISQSDCLSWNAISE